MSPTADALARYELLLAQAVAQLEADGIMVAAGKGPGVPRLSVPASVAAPVTAPVTTAFDRRASAEAEFAQAALAFAEVAQAEAAEAAALLAAG